MIYRTMASFDELTWVVAGMLQGNQADRHPARPCPYDCQSSSHRHHRLLDRMDRAGQ
jgi:hypothetical protein